MSIFKLCGYYGRIYAILLSNLPTISLKPVETATETT